MIIYTLDKTVLHIKEMSSVKMCDMFPCQADVYRLYLNIMYIDGTVSISFK